MENVHHKFPRTQHPIIYFLVLETVLLSGVRYHVGVRLFAVGGY